MGHQFPIRADGEAAVARHDRPGGRLDAEPGVARDGEIVGIAGPRKRAGLAGKEVRSRRSEVDGLLAGARDDILEFDAGGAEADRVGVGDIVGDGVEPLLQRHLRRQ